MKHNYLPYCSPFTIIKEALFTKATACYSHPQGSQTSQRAQDLLDRAKLIRQHRPKSPGRQRRQRRPREIFRGMCFY